MRLILGLAAVVCLVAGPAAERASADILYELKNVKLEYLGKAAGSLTGSFVTNDARTQLIDVNIVASGVTLNLSSRLPPAVFQALTYTLGNSTSHSSLKGSRPSDISLARAQGGAGSLFLGFVSGLAKSGKSLITRLFSNESQGLLLTRTVSSGSVVGRRVEPPAPAAVPEPSALAVAALSGPALLVYARRRRKGMTAA